MPLPLWGETIYIITSVADVSAVYHQTDNLTFDAYITDTMANMGASPDATRQMWQTPQQQSKTQFANPKNEPLAHLSLTIFQHQLHPGKPMQELEAVLAVVKPGKACTVSLLQWTTSMMLKGATEAFFGEAMLRIDPNMLEDYSYFNKHSWKLIYKVPPPWSTGMRTARDAVRTTFAKHFSLPEAERSDACWMMKALELEMKACGISPQDIGSYLMSIYWVIDGNAWKSAFWMLIYILDDEALLANVQKEADAAGPRSFRARY
ncbi:hypothetical protein GQ44DRAFT_766542 [Phaeosphaeriaceae sp. PMI808]|nr:hypothetical protein GQ44DRAFT_766542 [Phaeosphaeriaceae sp. PMI808]